MIPQQVAERLQPTTATIYRYIREGKLVASRFGPQYRITRRNVDLLLLTTSAVGGAALRAFGPRQIAEWLAEDTLDEETPADGRRLLDALT